MIFRAFCDFYRAIGPRDGASWPNHLPLHGPTGSAERASLWAITRASCGSRLTSAERRLPRHACGCRGHDRPFGTASRQPRVPRKAGPPTRGPGGASRKGSRAGSAGDRVRGNRSSRAGADRDRGVADGRAGRTAALRRKRIVATDDCRHLNAGDGVASARPRRANRNRWSSEAERTSVSSFILARPPDV